VTNQPFSAKQTNQTKNTMQDTNTPAANTTAKTTTNTPAADPAPAPATPQDRSSINQKLADKITRAETTARTAQKGAYAAALAQHGIAADFTASILTRCTEARGQQTQALIADAASEGDNLGHIPLGARLAGLMQQIQAWARAKLFFTNHARLDVYHIGETLDANEGTFKQFSLDVRDAGVADALPGITPAFLAEYNTTRDALFGPETPAADDQPAPDAEAVDVRAALDIKVTALFHDSMVILFTADGIWPYWKDGSAGPRHAFGLPGDRPYAPPAPTA
jgi:hypothetical protein